MADLSVMSFLNEETQQEAEYNLKDAQARTDIGTINSKIPSAASSNNKLVDTTAMNDAIGQAVSAAYKPAGNKTVAELTSSLLVAANRGKVYNMTDAGTTTADFVEGAGHPIRIGDDVGICEPTTGTFKFNILSGFIAVDTNPTQSSANPVSSGGVYAALASILNGENIDSFGDVETALADKVDKVVGKGLSTNDYNNTAKGIVDTAQDNIKANTKLIKDTVGWSGKNKFDIKKITPSPTVYTLSNTGFSNVKIDTRTSNIWVSAFKNNASVLSLISPTDLISTGHKEFNISIPSNTDYNQIRLGHNGSVNDVKIYYPFNKTGDYILSFDADGVDISTEGGYILSNIMIRPADILDDTYEPYFGSTAVDWASYANTGIHNQLNLADITNYGQWTYANGEFKNNVTDTRANLAFTVQGRKNGTFVKNLGGVDCTSVGKYSLDFTLADTDDINQLYIGHLGSTTDLKFTLSFTKKGNFKVRVNATGIDPTTVNGIVLKELMITDATDTFEGYTDFAMTNKELTEKVQGIIDAATNAADFAAFKTAIAAL